MSDSGCIYRHKNTTDALPESNWRLKTTAKSLEFKTAINKIQLTKRTELLLYFNSTHIYSIHSNTPNIINRLIPKLENSSTVESGPTYWREEKLACELKPERMILKGTFIWEAPNPKRTNKAAEKQTLKTHYWEALPLYGQRLSVFTVGLSAGFVLQWKLIEWQDPPEVHTCPRVLQPWQRERCKRTGGGVIWSRP